MDPFEFVFDGGIANDGNWGFFNGIYCVRGEEGLE